MTTMTWCLSSIMAARFLRERSGFAASRRLKPSVRHSGPLSKAAGSLFQCLIDIGQWKGLFVTVVGTPSHDTTDSHARTAAL